MRSCALVLSTLGPGTFPGVKLSYQELVSNSVSVAWNIREERYRFVSNQVPDIPDEHTFRPATLKGRRNWLFSRLAECHGRDGFSDWNQYCRTFQQDKLCRYMSFCSSFGFNVKKMHATNITSISRRPGGDLADDLTGYLMKENTEFIG